MFEVSDTMSAVLQVATGIISTLQASPPPPASPPLDPRHWGGLARRVALGGGKVGPEDLGREGEVCSILFLGNREGTEAAAMQWK